MIERRHLISLSLLNRKGEMRQDSVGYSTGNDLVTQGLATKRKEGAITLYTITDSGRKALEGFKG
jgi:predicted transcriptional regulator with HTH domain